MLEVRHQRLPDALPPSWRGAQVAGEGAGHARATGGSTVGAEGIGELLPHAVGLGAGRDRVDLEVVVEGAENLVRRPPFVGCAAQSRHRVAQHRAPELPLGVSVVAAARHELILVARALRAMCESAAVAERILVVGSGGREHALAVALARSPGSPAIHCAPGNPGIAEIATTHAVAVDDHAGLVRLATEQRVGLVVVGPEAPLVAGLVDEMAAAGIAAFGPTAAAARLEGSKAFAKEVMASAGVPAAASVAVTTVQEGVAAVDQMGFPIAIKADGLASGKGVVVAMRRAEAIEAIEACLADRRFGAAGDTVLIEEGLVGPEVSLLAVCDGTRVVRFPAARDYKPIGDGNTGPNTGGMGSVSPIPDVPDALADELVEQVHRPVVAEMARRGTPFTGVLYAGLMMTVDGPRVLEFNTRFGDPETQALLPRVDGDLAGLLEAAAHGELPDAPFAISDDPAVAVVLASEGYPAAPVTGDPIEGLAEAGRIADVYHAGTAPGEDGGVVTAGGRVLAVSARGASVADARAAAYRAADAIRFRGMQRRSDIAAGIDGAAS